MRDGWGQPDPLYRGDGLIDLHDGAGTEWRRTPDGQTYPTCECHMPAGLRELEAKATGPVAIIRTTTERPTWLSATPTPSEAPDPVIASLDAPDDESADAGRVLIAMLRRLAAKL